MMKKSILFTICFYSVFLCYSQRDTTSKGILKELYKQSSLTVSFKDLFKEYVQEYADSINKYKGNRIPYFLKEGFDDIEMHPFTGFHDREIFRRALFRKITNKKILKKIIASSNPIFDEIEIWQSQTSSYSLPYSTISVRDLAKLRLKELKFFNRLFRRRFVEHSSDYKP